MIFESHSSSDGITNMRLDAQKLLWAEEGIFSCRIYTWNGPWVSLGYTQNPQRDLVSNCEIKNVKRPTGGRAVLHGHDLTVCIAAPLILLNKKEQCLTVRSVKKVYRILAQPLIQSFQASAIDAVLGEEATHLYKNKKSADCFAHVSANDIIDRQSGLKICGCALKLTEKAVLLQASIPINKPLIDPIKVFHVPAKYSQNFIDREIFEKSLKQHLLNL